MTKKQFQGIIDDNPFLPTDEEGEEREAKISFIQQNFDKIAIAEDKEAGLESIIDLDQLSVAKVEGGKLYIGKTENAMFVVKKKLEKASDEELEKISDHLRLNLESEDEVNPFLPSIDDLE